MLAAGDTFRAAAIEQLHVWAERTGSLFSAQQTGADPGAVIFDALKSAQARGVDVLLADTAGRLHSQTHLMDELKKVKRVIARVLPEAPHEVLLVLDANQGQNALAQAQQFHAALGVTGLVLTKLDGTARGGIVVAIARKLKLPIRFIGVGEKAEDFGVFNARAFASALVDGAADERAQSGAAAGSRRRSRDQLRARQQALSQRARSAHGPELRHSRRRDGVPHRSFRRRQEHRAQADRTARAARRAARCSSTATTRPNCRCGACRCFAAAWAWCFRITGC